MVGIVYLSHFLLLLFNLNTVPSAFSHTIQYFSEHKFFMPVGSLADEYTVV